MHSPIQPILGAVCVCGGWGAVLSSGASRELNRMLLPWGALLICVSFSCVPVGHGSGISGTCLKGSLRCS